MYTSRGVDLLTGVERCEYSLLTTMPELGNIYARLLSQKVTRSTTPRMGMRRFGSRKIIELTNREFALLELLMMTAPRPVSKAVIVERVWNQCFDSQTNVVNVYVNHLRSKIDLPGLVPIVQTVRGVGFAPRKADP